MLGATFILQLISLCKTDVVKQLVRSINNIKQVYWKHKKFDRCNILDKNFYLHLFLRTSTFAFINKALL